jgi:hypothetical protein
MNIILLAFRLMARAGRYADRARQFFYQVVLSEYRCLSCQGTLEMIKEGSCRCRTCRRTYDPTVAFQRCTQCGGRPELMVRRYRCSECGAPIASRFLFDGAVFDTGYFREKMAESRKRKKEQRQRVKQMLAESRSMPLGQQPIEFGAVPGLVDALNGLTGGLPEATIDLDRVKFDLQRYRRHILSQLDDPPVDFEDITPLGSDRRIDRIWRFIAIIFMAHAGEISIRQQGQTILIDHETHRERQGIPGEAEESDEFEGPLGRAAAW